ncbi:MAG: SH3 domain-containing protein [Chlamydiales bacterium]
MTLPKFTYIFLIPLFLLGNLYPQQESDILKTKEKEIPFTGRVTHHKVRVRAEPQLESQIVKEANKGDFFIILDELEDFYVIKPPKDIKVYIYRTFVIDQIIEGSKVNVRLFPSLEAFVVAQLNNGDRVEGEICPDNPRWYAITPPESTRFYIAKDYVEKVGSVNFLSQIEKKMKEAEYLLSSAKKMGEEEFIKTFEDIALDEIYGYLDKVINDYQEFPQYVTEAKKLSSNLQKSYLQKKIHFLEEKVDFSSDSLKNPQTTTIEEIKLYQEQLREITSETTNGFCENNTPSFTQNENPHTVIWHPIEQKIFEDWMNQQENKNVSLKDFYSAQLKKAVMMKGVIKPYEKPVKDKPGDYLLINRSNQLPLAYLYSTHVNLHDYIGLEVYLVGVKRDNNHFAFPAYYVIEITPQQSHKQNRG